MPCGGARRRRIRERGFGSRSSGSSPLQIAEPPDSDFYRTFLNSITRDLFATVGVDEQIEFTATASGRASGSVPIRVHPVGDSLHRAVCELLVDLPFSALIDEVRSSRGRSAAS